MTTSGEIVFCVLCVEEGENDRVHIFSTKEKAVAWSRAQPGPVRHIFYDYVVDDPKRMTEQPETRQ